MLFALVLTNATENLRIVFPTHQMEEKVLRPHHESS